MACLIATLERETRQTSTRPSRHWRKSTEIGRDDPAGQPARINNLGGGLNFRYNRTGSIADLDAMVAAYQEVVAATAADDPTRPAALHNLGTCLRERYARMGEMEDLEAAIALSRGGARDHPARFPRTTEDPRQRGGEPA